MEQQYQLLVEQMKALIEGEHHRVSVLANAAALLKQTFAERYFWVGFYMVENDQLELGPFQGTVACYHIKYGRGVCGTAWERRQTIVVDDVEQFPGHIACSSLSQSEIVVPLINSRGEVVGVLDIDSTEKAAFNATDQHYLEEIAKILVRQFDS